VESYEQFDAGTLEATLAVSTDRARDMLSTLHGLGFVGAADGEVYWTAVSSFFLKAWEAGDLETLTELLKRFGPFATFLEFLDRESVLPIHRTVPKKVWEKMWSKDGGWSDWLTPYLPLVQSAGNAEVAVERLEDSTFVEHLERTLWASDIRDYSTKELNVTIPNLVLQRLIYSHGIGLNLVKVDNMGRWGANVGAVYLSEGFMYYGCDSPSQDLFNQSLIDEYWQTVHRPEYVRLGDLIDSICKQLRISLPRFDLYFQRFYEENTSTIEIAGVIPISFAGEYTMDILNPRGAPAGRFFRRTASHGVMLDGVHFTTIRMEMET